MKSKSILKHTLAYILSLLIIIGAVPVLTVSAESASDNLNGFSYEISDNKATIVGYTSDGGDITIPATIDGYPVTRIGNMAFYDCNHLTSIIIPEGVTSIGDDTFSGCTSLTNVTIPSTVTSIGSMAFCYCLSLTDITIPEGVKNIGDDAFRRCYGLTSITLPPSVEHIGDGAFTGCQDFTIYGCEDTYAEAYAQSERIDFVLTEISVPSYELGDTNLDGNVNIKDATAIQKHIAELVTLSDKGKSLADYNGDSRITIQDATAIQKFIAGLI